jgi:lipid A 3-O-deacylase
MLIRLLFFFTFLFTFHANAQELYQQPVLKGFSINYDNDFFSATDQYFTQGIRFELYSPFIKKIPVRFLLPRIHKTEEENFGLTANQQCFTPTSIRRDTVFTGNHPFAGAIFLGFTRMSNSSTKQDRLSSELDLGGIGPCASCKETQENIHKWLKNIQPLGWEFQVRDDIVINYALKYEKGVFDANGFDAQLIARVNAGTLYDDAGFGLRIRGGWKDNYFKIISFSDKFQCYAFLSGEVRYAGYNGALEGGMFNHTSVYVVTPDRLEHLVISTTQGLVLKYHKLFLEYTKFFQSPEYETGREHSWGHCNITILF